MIILLSLSHIIWVNVHILKFRLKIIRTLAHVTFDRLSLIDRVLESCKVHRRVKTVHTHRIFAVVLVFIAVWAHLLIVILLIVLIWIHPLLINLMILGATSVGGFFKVRLIVMWILTILKGSQSVVDSSHIANMLFV